MLLNGKTPMATDMETMGMNIRWMRPRTPTQTVMDMGITAMETPGMLARLMLEIQHVTDWDVLIQMEMDSLTLEMRSIIIQHNTSTLMEMDMETTNPQVRRNLTHSQVMEHNGSMLMAMVMVITNTAHKATIFPTMLHVGKILMKMDMQIQMTRLTTMQHSGMIPMETDMATTQMATMLIYSRTILQNGTMRTAMA